MEDANKIRFYIDQAIMQRDYEALAGFEGRLAVLETPAYRPSFEQHTDPPLSEGPVWLPK
ncbi:MAG: hypothetical protein HN350_18110 [Phycisphaerales bacterium]|jgi:hypothetical protein|nr:hypothetical protein [Phycisphaerales bacterium]